MKVCTVCHGNIARSQILHQYLTSHAASASVKLDLFSCGTASWDAYSEVDRLLDDVRTELARRGVPADVRRNVFDEAAQLRLVDADLVLVADAQRKQEVLSRLEGRIDASRVKLFYEFIGEGPKDFVDTYDADQGAQDPERFANCFDELERIAQLAVAQIRKTV